MILALLSDIIVGFWKLLTLECRENIYKYIDKSKTPLQLNKKAKK